MTGYQAVDGHGEGTGPIGLEAFLARADELADRYGERFRPTAYLRELEAFPA
jgi:3-hydroxyacyl-CoA dehydrogenase/enoyl-CoA hydratase/3-hydroxybutyryl-CoA epimerase